MAYVRKYLDRERTLVNPAWVEKRERTLVNSEERMSDVMVSMGQDPAVYFPGEKAIPEEGAWVLVLEEPYTVLRDRFRLPLLSMWRARPHTLNDGAFQIRDGVRVFPKQAIIATPAGDLHLWPHEYQVVRDPIGLASCEGAEIHQLGGEAALDEDHMFYLQSRGIPHHEAVMLLFDTIVSPDYVYVTFPEEITAFLEGAGQPLWRHIQLHPRQPESQAEVEGEPLDVVVEEVADHHP